ncbi:hypothetical protein MMC11_008339 [Xylographa trunciseda]|nr:hypothetical protein [Xylographa trunciseda]
MADISLLVLLLSVVFGALYIASMYIAVNTDPREPPFVSAKIPFVGHAYGLLKYGQSHWKQIDAKYHLPIYTVGLLRRKAYIVTSLDLVNSVHKNYATLDFTPFVKTTAQKLSGLQPEHLKLFDKHDGREGLSEATITGIEAALKQSDADDLSVPILKEIVPVMEAVTSQTGPCKLHASLRHMVTLSSSIAFYGPQNPLNSREVEDAFWVFEENGSILLTDFLPSLKAGRALRARQTVAAALTKYYKEGGHLSGSALTRARYESAASYGLGDEDIAQIEVPFMFALLNNVVPAAFWTLSEILTDASLLHALRSEVVAAIHQDSPSPSSSSSPAHHTLSLALLKRRCPLLLSTYHEALRHRTSFSSARFVTADTTISDGTHAYLLKAGALVQIPTDVVHAAPQHWGPDAAATDTRRFTDPARRKTHPLAFRSFGGAPFICPGRQIATTQILALLAMLITRYDLEPVQAPLRIPLQNLSMFASVPPPKGDVEVLFREREEWKGAWDFEVGERGLQWMLESG